MEILSLAIEAAFKSRANKRESLEKMRIKIGVLQNLLRTENELKIIEDKTYQRLSEEITEISKMNNGWLNYIAPKEP